MAGESSRPGSGVTPNSGDGDADSQEPSIVGEDVRSLAAGLAQKLREVNIDCEILPVVPIPTTAVRRDRVVVVLGLMFLTASAWAYLIWISVDMAMGGMNMAGYRMIPSGIGLMMPSDRPWQPIEFAFVFAMWVVMMAAMMTPSAAPMILMYARVSQFIETRTTPLAATVCFSGGYFFVWVTDAWAAPWRLLLRLLLGTDGATVRRRCDEHALDRRAHVAYPRREGCSLWPPVRRRCRHSPYRDRCVVAVDRTVLTAAMTPPRR